MPRWETYLALLAVILACLGTIHFVPGHVALTAVAIVLLAIVAGSRLLAALRGRASAQPNDAAERARKIREARDRQRR
jgi:multisubunit Na+/H+ antiporter MnhG subunit